MRDPTECAIWSPFSEETGHTQYKPAVCSLGICAPGDSWGVVPPLSFRNNCMSFQLNEDGRQRTTGSMRKTDSFLLTFSGVIEFKIGSLEHVNSIIQIWHNLLLF